MPVTAAQDWAHAGTSLKRGTLNIEEEREILTPQLRTGQLVDGEGSVVTTCVYFTFYNNKTRYSILVSGCIQFTLFGAGTVYLILSSQIFQELLSGIFPNASFCFWFLLIAIILTPPMWLGSPKDFS